MCCLILSITTVRDYIAWLISRIIILNSYTSTEAFAADCLTSWYRCYLDADGWTAVSHDGLEIPVEFSDIQGIIYTRAHAADDGVFLVAPGIVHFLPLKRLWNNS